MRSHATRRTNGNATRERILECARVILRREGIDGLSMRAVASAASVGLSVLQFHFGSQDAFTRAAIQWWANEISRELDEAAGDSSGLARTWKLCEHWVMRTLERDLLSLHGQRMEAHRKSRDSARGMFVSMLDAWVMKTHRSLHQARSRDELREGVGLRTLAVELHRLVWSHEWSRALYGRENSQREILETVRRRLLEVAANAERALPVLEQLPASSTPGEDEDECLLVPAEYGPDNLPTWRVMLDPLAPLFHAFLRHERFGDPRSFLDSPKVLPEDVAEADAFRARHPRWSERKGAGGNSLPLSP